MQVAPEMLSSSAGTPRPPARSCPPLLLRHVGHAQRVAPYLVPVARHPRVVRPALRCRERHPAVPAAVEVVVVAVRLVLSRAVVDGPEKGVRQRPAPARAARQVELVGPPRFEFDREPVLIAVCPDGAGGRAADRDPAGSGVVVGQVRVPLRDALLWSSFRVGAAVVSTCTQRERSLVPCALMALIR